MKRAPCSKCGHVEPPDYDPEFGKRLRRMREAAGLSIVGLARLSGTGASLLGMIEGGHRSPKRRVVEPVLAAIRKRARELEEALIDNQRKQEEAENRSGLCVSQEEAVVYCDQPAGPDAAA